MFTRGFLWWKNVKLERKRKGLTFPFSTLSLSLSLLVVLCLRSIFSFNSFIFS